MKISFAIDDVWSMGLKFCIQLSANVRVATE